MQFRHLSQKFLICRALGVAVFFMGGTLGYSNPAQTVSVLTHGAAGNGTVDDTAAIQAAIDGSPEWATIDFGDQTRTYLISQTVALKPNRAYTGTAAIVMSPAAASGTVMMRASYAQSDNLRIEGLTFDANRVGGILQVATNGGYSIPAKNVTVRDCRFQNTRPAGDPWDGAIYNSVGLQNGTITRNKFKKCSFGIFLANPDNVSITSNDFDTITAGDAIFIPTYNHPFTYGNRLTISDNTGRNLRRMAIEIWGGGGNVMNAPVVQRNVFSNWDPHAIQDAFGISVVVGSGARILNNTLSGGANGYGIEAGVPLALVSGNSVTGFPTGIIIQGQPDVTIQNNRLTAQTDTAILLSNAGNNLRTKVLNNIIDNPQKFGIGAFPNDFGGSVFSGNVITRTGGYFPGDGAQTFPFIGIKIDSGLHKAITVHNNRITQTNPAPPRGFGFVGIGFFGGVDESQYLNNIIESTETVGTGTGFLLWSANYLDSSTVSGNTFTGLYTITNGNTSARIKASGNSACRVTVIDKNVVSTGNSCR